MVNCLLSSCWSPIRVSHQSKPMPPFPLTHLLTLLTTYLPSIYHWHHRIPVSHHGWRTINAALVPFFSTLCCSFTTIDSLELMDTEFQPPYHQPGPPFFATLSPKEMKEAYNALYDHYSQKMVRSDRTHRISDVALVALNMEATF